ncbi:MAG: T9SS type A sorting domain-containing protein [Crocinitomicaceae bacterium]
MRRIFFALFVLHIFTSIAQNETVVGYFHTEELNGYVLLTWNIKQGNTCNGVKVEHSIDSLNFNEIGSIEGICGSNSSDIDYEFTHQSPTLNTVNYYRLFMPGIGYSWVVSRKVIAINNPGYTIAPNPVTSNSVLYFENSNNQRCLLKIMNMAGNVVHLQELFDEQVYLGEIGLESALYFFEIQEVETSTSVRGKFIVP